MVISLLDGTLKVDIYFEQKDCEFGDNVCLSIVEKCPDDEKVFRGDETNLYLTSKQARKLASALLNAAEESDIYCSSKEKKHEKSL